jgi:HPt (histidine-containing phosphotransfer) domain-containing protein
MAPSFDEAELLERVDNDVDFLGETVQLLAGDGRALLARATQAAASGDAPELVTSAHALKGMISNFCAPSVHELARDLEEMARSGDMSGAPPLVERLRSGLETLITELLDFVQARSR